MPALAAVTVSATPHAPGGRDCPPRHLSDAPRELGLVAVSRHLKYSALLRSSRGTSTPPVRHRRDIRHRPGAPLPAGRTMPLAPCLGPFVVPANCAVSATPPSRTCVRIDRSVVAVPPRHPRVFSKGPLPHQHAIDATHFEANKGPSRHRRVRGFAERVRLRRSAAPSRLRSPCLRGFARLDVCGGLRGTRASAWA